MASGAPTEDEVQSQWRKAVDIIDQTRVYADGLAGGGQEFDTLVQALEGDFTPDALSTWASAYREGLSQLVDPSIIFDAIAPCILEYGQVLKTAGAIGSGYEDIVQLKIAIYEHFISASPPEFVESRAMTYGSQTVTGTGDGTISRLTVDENAFDLEACHAEKKVFRCRQDQNSGVKELAEVFEMVAETRSRDNLLHNSFGSGSSRSTLIQNRNGGSGTNGGSLLKNSSFSDYSVAATNDFTGWELVSGTVPTQDTTNSYLTFPNAGTDASMQFSTSARLKQSLSDMRVSGGLNSFRPYFLRAMVNADIGVTASGGSFVLHLGNKSLSTAITAIAGNGWLEIKMPLDKDLWFKNFNEDDFNIEVEWTGASSGTLLVDDLIFSEWDAIDGTFWICRMNDATPVSWLVDDEIAFTDSQADTTKGKINYYLWRIGLGYLPHSTGSPTITFADP